MPPNAVLSQVIVPIAGPSDRLRVADVAVWYGARSGGIRTYLDAKARIAEDTGLFEHHLVIPSEHERHTHGRHELPGVQVGAANGYRMPLDPRPLLRTLGPSDRMSCCCTTRTGGRLPPCVARGLGAAVIAVHHGTPAAGAIGKLGPEGGWRRALSACQRRLYRRVDAVMATGARPPEAAGVPVIPLRYGVHAAFRPRSGCKRGEHVLYVGRLSPEKGLELLFDAMAASTGDWPLHLIGDGPAEPTLRRRAERLGLERRVIWLPFVHEPGALARAYAEAACVVVPGSHETFGLIALEAAASGAAVVASSAVPSASFVPGLVDLFPAGDASALAATIARAVASKPDPVAAMRLSKRSSWRTAIEAEIADLGTLRR